MTVTPAGRLLRTLSSSRVATPLLVFVGLWSGVASFVPQGGEADPEVIAWAAAHPVAEAVVGPLGLHGAFGAPVFLACAFLLGLSTALCASRRTRVAFDKVGALRGARDAAERPDEGHHDVRIPLGSGTSADMALHAAREGLRAAGIAARREGDRVVAISPVWSVWGSPVFHWALFAVMLVLPASSLLRSSGQIGLAVGQSKADVPASYGSLVSGPLHRWRDEPRTIRLDAFDITYRSAGINRGPTPTVTVSDPDGSRIASQRVYPNNTLKLGALTIYPADYGLAVPVVVTAKDGGIAHEGVRLLDFSAKADGGTAPVGGVPTMDDADGRLSIAVSVPLDRVEGGMAARIPDSPRARVIVAREGGGSLVDRLVAEGESVALPNGGAVRIGEIGYYARLQLVEDPTIPLLYAAIVVAMLGLGVATLARQHIVTASVIETDAGRFLAVRARLWRNVVSNSDAIASEISTALPAEQERVT